MVVLLLLPTSASAVNPKIVAPDALFKSGREGAKGLVTCVYMKNIIKHSLVFWLSVLAMMMKKMIILTHMSTRLECIITG